MRCLRLIPSGWSFEEGASFLAQAMTAWYGLVELGCIDRISQPRVLIHSIAGGVGLFAAEICEHFGSQAVVGTIGDPAKRSFVEKRFPKNTSVVLREGPSRFPEQLAAFPQFDIVFDAISGPFFHAAYARLDKGGKHIIYGAGDMMPTNTRPNWLVLAWKWLWRPTLDPLQMISDNKSVIGFNLIWLWEKLDTLGAMLDLMLAVVKWRKPYVDPESSKFTFENLPDALKYFQKGKSTGKVVVTIQ